jgi:hypothetical protein
MPTFAAIILASVTNFAVAQSLRDRLSTRAAAAAELVIWLVVFGLTRTLLRRLRPSKK